MIINHNLGAMNAMRNMGVNSANANKSMEKLSSGLKINRAGDDAAGLAISEKMRGQIRGLDQASANAQDGISMVQTAEGALSETQSILQRMRELAVQSGNDTNVGVDRTEIQKEMNQLSSEINRIGNTTEFNTQKVLAGDNKVNLTETGKTTNANLTGGAVTTTEATQTVTIGAAATNGQTAEFTLNGEKVTLTFATNDAADQSQDGKAFNITGNSATIYLNSTKGSAVADSDATGAKAIRDALKEVIAKNDNLKGNFSVTGTGADVTVSATKTGLYAGAAGNIAVSGGDITGAASRGASVGVTNEVKAKADGVVDFSGVTSSRLAQDFVGKGFTVGDKQIEFYNADKGVYTGTAIGVNISGVSSANGMINAIINQAGAQVSDVVFSEGTLTNVGKLDITAKDGGESGNNIRVTDGGAQKSFEATLQVGANQGQQFKIDIADMRANGIAVTSSTAGGTDSATGAKYTATNTVTNGTDSTTREAALDVSTAENATNAVKTINNAIESVSSERSKLGAFQNRLEHTIANLGTSSENLTSAESRVRDVDMAKEMSTFSKNNILSQAAQAMLAQANNQPQQVLQLLR